MPLSVLKIENTKPKAQAQKLADGNGLYLYVPALQEQKSPARRPPRPLLKSWRFDFRFGDRRNTLTFGPYPLIGLAEARDRLREAKRLLADGQNPALEKKVRKLVQKAAIGDSFEAVAENWYNSKKDLRSHAWRANNSLYLRRDLNPRIGNIPIKKVDRVLVLAVLETTKVERGVKTAERVRQTAVQVFDHGIRKIKADENPARMLKGWTEVPRKVSHKPLREGEIHKFLDRVDAYPGFITTKICIKLLFLLFVRKNELVKAKWEEFDLERACWIVPAERMKTKQEHVVPLSRQALAALRQVKVAGCGSLYLFPHIATIDKPMSGSTLNVAFQKMGYAGKFNPHGIRATASTWLNGNGFRPDIIERQLAHTERNQVRAAYNQADYLRERIALMQAWADFLEPKTEEAK